MYEHIVSQKNVIYCIHEAQSIFGTQFVFPNTALGKVCKNKDTKKSLNHTGTEKSGILT